MAKNTPNNLFDFKYMSTMDILMNYKPNSVEQLAEWLMIAARNVVDQEGKRIFYRLDGPVALQMAQMMQKANLKVPE